ncbi:hypothetical protein Tco_0966991 [Tanacetum coccineum]
MAALESCPRAQHDRILWKTEGNVKFHEVIDFLRRSYVYHALTVSPIVSTTFVEQFWMSAKSKTINNVRHITAKVAGKFVSISEASIRTDLIFDDADGISKVTPLFDTMLVQPTQAEGVSSERLSAEQSSPSPAPTSEQQPDPSPSPSPRPSPQPLPTPIVPDSIPEPTEDAQSEGRIKEMMDEDKEIDEDRLSTEDAVSTDKEGVSTDFEKVSTDKPLVSTDGSKTKTSHTSYQHEKAKLFLRKRERFRVKDVEEKKVPCSKRFRAIRKQTSNKNTINKSDDDLLKAQHVGNFKQSELKSKNLEDIQSMYEKDIKVSWKLHGSLGVHTLMTDEGLVIHMLIEKKYPLKKEILVQMLKLKLESEEESTMALELIRFIKKSWLVRDQTVLGKDYSNLLIADSLLKTIWFINAPCYDNEALASPNTNDEELSIPEQTATGKGTSNPLMAGCKDPFSLSGPSSGIRALRNSEQEEHPLSEFIDTRDIYDAQLNNNCTVREIIHEGRWIWPEEWNNEFEELRKIQVPILMILYVVVVVAVVIVVVVVVFVVAVVVAIVVDVAVVAIVAVVAADVVVFAGAGVVVAAIVVAAVVVAVFVVVVVFVIDDDDDDDDENLWVMSNPNDN